MMIDFKESRNNGVSWSDVEVHKKELEAITAKISKDLTELKHDRFALGVHLIELYRSRAYSIESRKYEPGLQLPVGVGNCSSEYFFAYCLDKFGLEKSQVSRYMNIVDEFGVKNDDDTTVLAATWDKFGYSQLAEMLPLTNEQRENITPDWSVRRIRDYKLSLVATSQHDKDAYKDAVDDAQKDKPLALPKHSKDSARYERFKGLTAVQLCDQYLALEQETEELRAENSRLERLYRACIEHDPDLELLESEVGSENQ